MSSKYGSMVSRVTGSKPWPTRCDARSAAVTAYSETCHPTRLASVACGTAFNLVRDDGGGVWAFGWSEFGVLGNGSDGQFNTSASSIKLSYEAQATPKPVLKLKGKTMVQVACGAAHCAAVEDDGTCYTHRARTRTRDRAERCARGPPPSAGSLPGAGGAAVATAGSLS